VARVGCALCRRPPQILEDDTCSAFLRPPPAFHAPMVAACCALPWTPPAARSCGRRLLRAHVATTHLCAPVVAAYSALTWPPPDFRAPMVAAYCTLPWLPPALHSRGHRSSLRSRGCRLLCTPVAAAFFLPHAMEPPASEQANFLPHASEPPALLPPEAASELPGLLSPIKSHNQGGMEEEVTERYF
jgi:hypothetical protein